MKRTAINRARAAGVLLLAGALALTACASEGAQSSGESLEDMEPVVLSIGHGGGPGSGVDKSWKAFMAQVSEETDGKVTGEEFFGGVLAPPQDTLAALADGRMDLTLLVVAYAPQDMPIANSLFDLDAEPTPSFPHQGAADSAAMTFMATNNEDYIAEFERNNVKILAGTSGYQGYELLCTEPFKTPADVEGRRVRAPGTTWAAQATALGMVPVDVGANELYESLQRGVIDCAIVTLAQIGTTSLWDVASYVTPGVFGGNPGTVYAMNKERYDSLPEEAQQIIMAAAPKLFETHLAWNASEYSRIAAEGTADHGLVFQDSVGWPEALEETNATLREKALTTLEAAGVADPEAFADDYRDAYQEWLDVLVDEVGYQLAKVDAKATEESFKNLDTEKLQEFIDLVKAEFYQ